jgi:hypothetical protein
MKGATMHPTDATLMGIAFMAAVIYYVFLRAPARRDEFGSSFWAPDKLLGDWGMLGREGLVLARTLSGKLIRLPEYCHVLLTGTPGSCRGRLVK